MPVLCRTVMGIREGLLGFVCQLDARRHGLAVWSGGFVYPGNVRDSRWREMREMGRWMRFIGGGVEGWRGDGDGGGGGVTSGVEGQRVDSRVGEASRGFECLGDNREDMRQQGIFRHDVITQTAVPLSSILSSPSPLTPPSSLFPLSSLSSIFH